ncbi:sorbosone dehydrogenase family protein [Knoellia sp. p5-6-4]|uniref:PQQ-dependent sugar dehydrogenase n=1 Tax=unclassified Knoellia TaxID=2618719 RepID=UPI0023DCCB2B|nr:PQQ-dependent sugar dehydrogenase [Knoellia sp. p5-6-4]MDF2144055.1 PQQ-dependent sugar dehydrogenase [Knoellia sp. p5-6-4]
MRLHPAAVTGALLVVTACTGAEIGSAGEVTPPSISAPSSSASSTASASTSHTAIASGPSKTTPSSTPAPRQRRTVATNLDVPWAIAFLPDGSALVTTRDQAQLLQVREGGATRNLGRVPGVEPGGEGGLLGVAASPDFSTDRSVFLYLTAGNDNRVVRVTFANGRASRPQPVLTGIPKAGNHNGGRLAFGPDGFLYVTTGDAGVPDRSQDRSSLGGKILRVTKDGRPAPGNPFDGSPVWSYGHRNVQGIAWDSDGRMFASEFGQNTWDELNLIRPGRNYGWPVVEGRAGRAGFVDPLRQWSTAESSPSGIAVTADGTVYLAALRGQSLWRVPTRDGVAGEPVRLLEGEYGRLRDVVVGPDGRLWVLTNNTSRGNPRPDDDRLLVIPESTLP